MEAYKKTIWFIDFYNSVRIHGSLKNKSPEEFIKNWTEKKEISYMGIRV